MLHHSIGVRLGVDAQHCTLVRAGMSRVLQQQQGQRTSRRRARGTGRQVVMNSLAPSQSARFSTLGIVALMPTICRQHYQLFFPQSGQPFAALL